MLGISQVAAQLEACQVVLSSIESVSFFGNQFTYFVNLHGSDVLAF
jgi:hypothetical protein